MAGCLSPHHTPRHAPNTRRTSRPPLYSCARYYLDGVDGRKVDAEAVVADLNVLVDGVGALLVRRGGERLARTVVELLRAAEEGEEARVLLGARRGDTKARHRLAQLVDGGVHRDGLVGDGLGRKRARPQSHWAEGLHDR